jgi:two-component system, sensor histidine kinase and response regulator
MEIVGYDASSVALLRQARCTAPGYLINDSCTGLVLQCDRSADLALRTVEASVQISDDDLRKITSELMDNALKFSKKGTPVQVFCQIDRGFFELRVIDQGRGMTPGQVSSIGAYMQFDRAVYEQQGLGLGLVICRRLAELYGGSFDLVSEPEHGTQVTIRLPIAA